VVLSELADSSVHLTTRAWAKSADVWSIFFETTEKVKETFDDQGTSIPLPQRGIDIYEQREEMN
jgi:small conductance mechanosensitive channel